MPTHPNLIACYTRDTLMQDYWGQSDLQFVIDQFICHWSILVAYYATSLPYQQRLKVPTFNLKIFLYDLYSASDDLDPTQSKAVSHTIGPLHSFHSLRYESKSRHDYFEPITSLQFCYPSYHNYAIVFLSCQILLY